MSKKRIYIGGRLNGLACDYIKNIHNMVLCAELVRKLGCAVFIPGIDFLCGVILGTWEYKDYFDNSQPFLDCCDAIFVTPNWETSEGTRREIERAKSQNIQVFYTIGELEQWLKGMK